MLQDDIKLCINVFKVTFIENQQKSLMICKYSEQLAQLRHQYLSRHGLKRLKEIMTIMCYNTEQRER